MSTVPFHNREGKLVDGLSERFDKLLATMPDTGSQSRSRSGIRRHTERTGRRCGEGGAHRAAAVIQRGLWFARQRGRHRSRLVPRRGSGAEAAAGSEPREDVTRVSRRSWPFAARRSPRNRSPIKRRGDRRAHAGTSRSVIMIRERAPSARCPIPVAPWRSRALPTVRCTGVTGAPRLPATTWRSTSPPAAST
jgi:hypothetical protein